MSIAASKNPIGILAVGGFAAILASTCCLGPLVLVLLGFSGAWIGSLTRLEPYRPWFLLFTLMALALAARPIFRPARECGPSEVCSSSLTRRIQQVIFVAVFLLALLAFVFPYLARFFY